MPATCLTPTLLLLAEEAVLLTTIIGLEVFPCFLFVSCTMLSSLSVKLLMHSIGPYVENGMALE